MGGYSSCWRSRNYLLSTNQRSYRNPLFNSEIYTVKEISNAMQNWRQLGRNWLEINGKMFNNFLFLYFNSNTFIRSSKFNDLEHLYVKQNCDELKQCFYFFAVQNFANKLETTSTISSYNFKWTLLISKKWTLSEWSNQLYLAM